MRYHKSIEQLLARYCDEAQVRESLHRAAYHHYKRKLTCMQLPIIILSALSGSLQLFSRSFPGIEGEIVTGTAFLSIGVSIISAVLSYLKLGEFKSKHEVSQIAWQNFHNSLVHQLNLAPEFRENAVDFIREVETTYARLFEISPMLSRSFMIDVRKRVKANASEKFIIPSYLNGFHHASIYREEEEFTDNTTNGEETTNVLHEVLRANPKSISVGGPEVVANGQRQGSRGAEHGRLAYETDIDEKSQVVAPEQKEAPHGDRLHRDQSIRLPG